MDLDGLAFLVPPAAAANHELASNLPVPQIAPAGPPSASSLGQVSAPVSGIQGTQQQDGHIRPGSSIATGAVIEHGYQSAESGSPSTSRKESEPPNVHDITNIDCSSPGEATSLSSSPPLRQSSPPPPQVSAASSLAGLSFSSDAGGTANTLQHGGLHGTASGDVMMSGTEDVGDVGPPLDDADGVTPTTLAPMETGTVVNGSPPNGAVDVHMANATGGVSAVPSGPTWNVDGDIVQNSNNAHAADAAYESSATANMLSATASIETANTTEGDSYVQGSYGLLAGQNHEAQELATAALGDMVVYDDDAPSSLSVSEPLPVGEHEHIEVSNGGGGEFSYNFEGGHPSMYHPEVGSFTAAPAEAIGNPVLDEANWENVPDDVSDEEPVPQGPMAGAQLPTVFHFTATYTYVSQPGNLPGEQQIHQVHVYPVSGAAALTESAHSVMFQPTAEADQHTDGPNVSTAADSIANSGGALGNIGAVYVAVNSTMLPNLPQTAHAQGSAADLDLGASQQPLPVAQVPVTAQNMADLNPVNSSLKAFLDDWASETHGIGRAPTEPKRPYVLSDSDIKSQLNSTATRISYEELRGDRCDLQGIDWTKMGVSRQHARERRRQQLRNYTSLEGTDKWKPALHETMSYNTETYFRFRTMHIKKAIPIPHFQLRNLLASASRSRAFYVAERRGMVRQFNTMTGADSVALRFADHSDVQISTIAAGQGVLVAGGFCGEYCITNIDSEYVDEKPYAIRSEGRVTTNQLSGISNHIDIHNLRCSGPLATFASNDLGLRSLDLHTQTILSNVQFPVAQNCTALSPDRRMRVTVGDNIDALIVAAEPERSIVGKDGKHRPNVLQRLRGHRDFGFACAWADDGYTVATGNQDRAIKIWDARKWGDASGQSTPVKTLRTELAGARSLRFSPAGSGKRVLIAAEEADIINVIDAQTFRTHQTFDIFGEIGGLALTNKGEDMLTLCADSARGGLLHFERCGLEAAAVNYDEDYDPSPRELRWRGATSFDWPSPPGQPRRERQLALRRRLRAAAISGLEPF